MRDWLLGKLQILTTEFLDGGGDGCAYEIFFLTYLECLTAFSGKDPNTVWSGWTERLVEAAGHGNRAVPLHKTADRAALAAALQAFQRDMSMAPIPTSEEPVNARVPERPEDPPNGEDLIGFLMGAIS